MSYSRNEAEPIAVVAIGSIYPGRGDTTGFWRDIVEGVDTFTSVPETHWLTDDYHDADPAARDRTYGSRGAFIPATSFDPLSFGIPPNSLSTTDTAQLLALVAARNVLDDLERHSAGPLDKSRASVILGVAATTELVGQMMGRLQRPAWVKGMREAGLDESLVQDVADRISSNFVEWRETTFPGLLGNVVAGRIANRLDFGGSNYVTDAACASSLSAMQIAMHELHAGDSDLVLTGGVDALNDIFMYMCFSKTPALSPSGDCRPLSADADGTMLGEGVGMLALRRLSDAERDGNRIHAIVKGLGGGSDGKATAVYAPLATGQVRTLNRAYEKAGYSPSTVELVEAHGTGTVAGDKTELDALHTVFDPKGEADSAWCALGSVKAQIGHTKAAAGAAGLLKVIGGLSRKILPPTIKIRQPAEALCQNTPFYLGTRARPWIRGSSHPRRASVSSFGFGGSNFHVTLEEYTGKHAVQPTRVMPAELLLISASTASGLREQVEALARDVSYEDDLARIAQSTWAQFNPEHLHRATIVAKTPEHLASLCVKLVALTQQSSEVAIPTDRHIHYQSGEPVQGKLALLFSGQGSQYVGMGADIAMAFPKARAVWDAACDVPATAALKLHDLAFPPSSFSAEDAASASARLTDMRHAQPAIAAVALSQLALLQQLGLHADMQAGHSFGEVMALHNAGVFDVPTALTIACERADAMSAAASSSTGTMLAVQASAATVIDVLATASEGITLANDNAPTQVVLSGGEAQLKQAASLLDASGIKSQVLPVAAAFHSPQVGPAVEPFAQKLAQHPLRDASTAVYANSTANPYPAGHAALATTLSEQIGKPVLFRQTLEAMHAAGVTTFIEVGPGSVLTNLVRQSLPADKVLAIALDNKHDNGTVALLCAIAQLAVAGVQLDLESLYEGLPAPQVRKEPGKHAVEILGSNYQKPYPPQVQQAPQPEMNDACSLAGQTSQTPHGNQANDGYAGEQAMQTLGATQANHVNKAGQEVQVPRATQTRHIQTAGQKAQTPRNSQTNHIHAAKQALANGSAILAQPHQTSSAIKSTMTMQNQYSDSSKTAQSHQSQTAPESSHHNTVANDTPAQNSVRGSAVSRSVFHDVSARHAEYMAAMNSAHQAYLRLAAGVVGTDDGVSLAVSEEHVASLGHMGSTQNYEAPMVAASLNGHHHMNGSSSASHASSGDGAMTNGSGNLGASTVSTHESPVNQSASRSNGVTSSPSLANGHATNGAAHAVSSTNGYASNGASPSPAATNGHAGNGLDPAPSLVNGHASNGVAEAPLSGNGQAANGQATNGQATNGQATNGHATNGQATNGAAQPRISTDLVRTLIADKTGYPVEMIEDDMDLSGELGIDSIKQVEVLAALRTQVPAIKDVGTADIGQLRTIRQIADFFG